jgi:flagellar motor component MotA
LIIKTLKYFRSGGLFIIPLIILSSLLLNSCSQKKNIDEDKFIKVYCDLLIAQDTTHAMNDKMKQEIFKKYSITKEEYNSIIQLYNNDPKKWDKFFDKAITYLQELRKKKDG